MGSPHPAPLVALLDGSDPSTRREAWTDFLAKYNGILLKAAGSYGARTDYDARMDRYRHILDALAADDYRRLRGYHAQSRSSFAAWLTVVARRLCVDYERSKVGRTDRTGGASAEHHVMRKRLRDLAGVTPDPDTLAEMKADASEVLEAEERHEALEAALAALSTRDRLLARLRFEDDHSVRAIADVMGFPSVFHVYRRLRLVTQTLRRALQARGFDADTL